MPHNIAYRIEGELAYVTLDRRDKLNGITVDMLSELIRVAGEIRRRRDIRVVILHGAGDAFSSGLDIAGTANNPLAIVRHFVPIPLRWTNTFQEACWAWRRLAVPVIAVTHGRCYGAALQLALAADFRISTPDCEFSVMEAKWGLIPDMSGSVTLSEVIGIDKAKLLAMTAEIVDGNAAERLGLVTALSDDPLDAARALATRLSERSPDAVAGVKRLFNSSWHAGPLAAFAAERRTQFRLLIGANAAIARKAGLQKLIPEFKPRQLL